MCSVDRGQAPIDDDDQVGQITRLAQKRRSSNADRRYPGPWLIDCKSARPAPVLHETATSIKVRALLKSSIKCDKSIGILQECSSSSSTSVSRCPGTRKSLAVPRAKARWPGKVSYRAYRAYRVRPKRPHANFLATLAQHVQHPPRSVWWWWWLVWYGEESHCQVGQHDVRHIFRPLSTISRSCSTGSGSAVVADSVAN